MDKARLLQAIIENIQRELDTQTRAALVSRDEATHEESKPENKYDMHAQEAAYLAEGQARLAAELHENLNAYRALPIDKVTQGDAAGIGNLVTLEAKGRLSHFFIGPRSGGLEIELDGNTITVVTPASPLGRQLVGARPGQQLKIQGRTGPVVHQVAAVQ
ncbi:MAG TPA: transcription elongation factor [Opitutaceae bacterium]|nr:transcription elongation factor [Opitutaceae bacterium]